MATTLTASEQPVAKIFSDDYVFLIPGYQRPYAWTTEQAQDLIDDLLGFMEAAGGPVEEMPPYFLGSVVLIKQEGVPNADVVDGQQRLTTLTILLAAIRARAHAPELTKLIYEKGSIILGTTDRPRLTLRERDRDFFQTYVQSDGGIGSLPNLNGDLSDSQKNIRDNAMLYVDRLGMLAEKDVLRLAQFTATRCFLVVVATPDIDSAYRIFSVLNSRGLDLAPTDILKAEIIGAIPVALRDKYTQRWEAVEEELGREAFTDLFGHIRMVYRRLKPKGTLIREFKEHVTAGRMPAAFIDDVLVPMAKAYEQIASSSYESTANADAVNEHLRWLNRLEFTDWVPPALAFVVGRSNDHAAMEEFFRDLERLAYGLLIRKVNINHRIERFSNLTGAVLNGSDLGIENSPLQLTPGEQLEIYDRLNGNFYATFAARTRTTILERLDTLLSGGGAQYDYQTTTVEHVLPQTCPDGSEWLTWFPDPDVRRGMVHRLGNLVLLTRKKNSAASNYEFSKKKDLYFSKNGISPFVLTTQVLKEKSWTPATVEKRQKELVEKLETNWRLEGRSGEPA